jgi:hypothetical protein
MRELMTDTKRKVFVLGAGFSVKAGFPLVGVLRDKIIGVLSESPWRVLLEPGNGDYPEGQFYAALNAVERGSPLPFEELLIALQQEIGSGSRVSGLCSLALDTLKDSCLRLFWGRQDAISDLPECYTNFRGWVKNWWSPGPTNAVITFNWDLVVEKALVGWWAYSVDGTGSTPVLKPHGSINWSTHLEQKLKAAYDGWKRIGDGSQFCYDALNPLLNPDKDFIHSPFLKYMKFPGNPNEAGERSSVKLIWHDVERALSGADVIVFIGYSLPDYDSQAAEVFRRHAFGKEIEVFNLSADDLAKYSVVFGEKAVLNCQAFESCPYARRPASWRQRADLRDNGIS